MEIRYRKFNANLAKSECISATMLSPGKLFLPPLPKKRREKEKREREEKKYVVETKLDVGL